MKRAPTTVASPSAAGGPARFSTAMVPPCAFDDLLGDRQAEARVLAKALMRTVGIKPLENLLQRVGAGHPARRQSTRTSTRLRNRRQVTRTVPPGGGE